MSTTGLLAWSPIIEITTLSNKAHAALLLSSVSTLSRKMRVRRPPPRSGLSWTPATRTNLSTLRAPKLSRSLAQPKNLHHFWNMEVLIKSVWQCEFSRILFEKLKCDHCGKEKVSWIYFFGGTPPLFRAIQVNCLDGYLSVLKGFGKKVGKSAKHLSSMHTGLKRDFWSENSVLWLTLVFGQSLIFRPKICWFWIVELSKVCDFTIFAPKMSKHWF